MSTSDEGTGPGRPSREERGGEHPDWEAARPGQPLTELPAEEFPLPAEEDPAPPTPGWDLQFQAALNRQGGEGSQVPDD